MNPREYKNEKNKKQSYTSGTDSQNLIRNNSKEIFSNPEQGKNQNEDYFNIDKPKDEIQRVNINKIKISNEKSNTKNERIIFEHYEGFNNFESFSRKLILNIFS